MFNVKVNKYNIQFTFKHLRDLRTSVANDATQCIMIVNGTEFQGQAVCSLKDAFCKERGRKVALARALKQVREKIEMSPGERRAVWDRYFARDIHNKNYEAYVEEFTDYMASGVLDPEYQKKSGSDSLENMA